MEDNMIEAGYVKQGCDNEHELLSADVNGEAEL